LRLALLAHWRAQALWADGALRSQIDGSRSGRPCALLDLGCMG